METSLKKPLDWHLEVLPKQTAKALNHLAKMEWLKKSSWYLAGGTALALQAGHRRSVDLDFFLPKQHFDNDVLLKNLYSVAGWKVTINKKDTIYGVLHGAKISFIAYPFFISKVKPHHYDSIRILNSTDIAVMKIIAISQRGRKRDFFDLYWCAQNLKPLESIIKCLKTQYPTVVHDYHHILKALVYFADAESDPDPTIYFDASWKQVKKFFIKEVPLAAKKLMKLK